MMKTRIAFTTLLLSLLSLLTACQKEEPHGTLPAGALRLTTESFTGANGDKTSVSGNTVNSGWRTLKDNTSSGTDDEWNYIFNTRQTGITIGPTIHSRYTMATINTDGTSVKGIILFPDNYIGPQENTSDISWGTINNKSNWSTSCTTAGWLTLENAGCVFLPAAGYRDHNSSPAEIHNIQTNGYYSSSSYKDEDGIYYLRFGNDDVGVDAQRNGNRHGGFAVRLVKDVN